MFAAAPVDVSKLPPPSETKIDFDQHIKPIFEKACFRCHGPERPKSGFRLDDRGAALKGGDNGIAIVEGKSAESPLIHYVAYLVEDMEMPPAGKGEKLTTEEIGLLRAWIDQGVVYGAAPTGPNIQFAVTTGVRYYGVSGDERKFREHNWQTEDWAGGLEHLRLQERLTNGVLVTTEARAIVDQNDYLLKLRLEKPDLGFIDAGFQQYRRYTDDTGLWYSGYNFPVPSLNQDLALDVGKSWIDLGLTLPNWPKMTLGYEHQYKEGDKSSLQYDYVSPDLATDPRGRALLPTRRLIDEEVHILKFDFDHDLFGVRVTDNFRGEFYNQTSTRDRSGVFAAGTISMDNGAREVEKIDHFQAANAFVLEKQFKKWLYVSGGYLYSRLDGGAELDRSIFVPVNPAVPAYLGEESQGILIGQETHAFSLNSLWGPWDGLSFYGTLQNDWMNQESLGASAISRSLLAVPDPSAFSSQISRAIYNEEFGLKYTKIPMTVVFADARWQQEDIGHAENYSLNDGVNDLDDFMRDTEARARLQQYRGGFTISPWQMSSFTANYKYRDKTTDYDHPLDFDLDPVSPGNGYPAFITERDMQTDDIEARAILRVARWVRLNLKYELVSTDFHTTTAPTTTGGIPSGGGPILAGNYDAHIYSAGATLSPWQRLRLSATFSYSQSRIISGVNNGAEILPYKGDIYSVISSATFALSQKTDLQASYFYSQANYDQPDTGANTPFGLSYNRHGLLAGVTHQWKPYLSTKLQYGFFDYSDPTTQGVNDYTAHAVFLSLTYSMN